MTISGALGPESNKILKACKLHLRQLISRSTACGSHGRQQLSSVIEGKCPLWCLGGSALCQLGCHLLLGAVQRSCLAPAGKSSAVLLAYCSQAKQPVTEALTCSCTPLQEREARVGNTEAETNHRGSALEQRRRLMEQKEAELEGLQKELWKKVGGMNSACLCCLPHPRSSYKTTGCRHLPRLHCLVGVALQNMSAQSQGALASYTLMARQLKQKNGQALSPSRPEHPVH